MQSHLKAQSVLLMAYWMLSGTQAGAMSLVLDPPTPVSARVGETVHFSAQVGDDEGGNLWYRFRVREPGEDYRVIRDYGPLAELDWTSATYEGDYEMEVSVRNRDSGEVATVSTIVHLEAVAIGDQPTVSSTSNSSVFLYSAPACAPGARMRVEFQGPDRFVQNTPYKPCRAGLTMNYYLAGLREDTSYTAHYRTDAGGRVSAGPDVSFTTEDFPLDIPSSAVIVASQKPVSGEVILASRVDARPMAHDLDGRVVWYGNDTITLLTRPEADGSMWGIVEVSGADTSQQIIRKFDLAGTTLLETNAARVNEQLMARGNRQISAFHHEVRTLPDGRIAALASVEQILTDVQGPGPVDVVGDMIVVFDKELNVVWTWDTFDNLDVYRMAVLGEPCPAACGPMMLANKGTDWTHGNAIQYTPDGNLLYSSRHQDWLIKIAYEDGDGDGHVIWRLGKDGDFRFDSGDSFPWFSHQHDGNFISPTDLLVFDNGNTRVAGGMTGNSRGQLIRLDETNRVATLVLNADLGVFAQAVGSASKLKDGNYHFCAGFVFESFKYKAYSLEISPSGKTVYSSKSDTVLYRSFRMPSMYGPD